MKKLAITLLLAVFVGLPAYAGTFLDIPTIPGESLDDQHPDEIEVLTWGQSVANLNNMPVVLPLVFTHAIDKATPKLIEAALMATTLERATLSVTATGGEEPFDYIVLKLIQPKVVSINSGGSDGALAAETVTLTCVSFQLRYRERMDDGSPGPFTEVEGSCGS